MLIETKAGALAAALKAVKPAVQFRNTLPILTAVLIKKGRVSVTDLDMELEVKFAAARCRGACVVPIRNLSGLMSHLPPDMDIKLTRPETSAKGDEETGVTVQFDGGRYTLPGFLPGDFPELEPPVASTPMKTVKGLKAALGACQGFISHEETRYYLNGIAFSRDADGKEFLVATDGHRLHAHPFGHGLGKDLILPRTAVAALLSLPEPERVEVSETQMHFHHPGGGSLKTKLIDGTFPDWRRVVPQHTGDEPGLSFAPLEMIRLLKRMKTLRDRHSGAAVELSASQAGDLVVAAAKGCDQEQGAERIAGAAAQNWPLEGTTRGFNANYLIEICKLYIAQERIRIIGKDKGSPAVIGPEGDDGITVLMPMRTDNAMTRRALLEFSRHANDLANTQANDLANSQANTQISGETAIAEASAA